MVEWTQWAEWPYFCSYNLVVIVGYVEYLHCIACDGH